MTVPKGHTNQIESIQKCNSQSHLPYSVDSIKHTVLLKVLFQIFLLVSIKSTVHWKFSRQINLRTVSIKNTVFNSVQCTLHWCACIVGK